MHEFEFVPKFQDKNSWIRGLLFFAHILDPKFREIRAFVANSIFPIFGQI